MPRPKKNQIPNPKPPEQQEENFASENAVDTVVEEHEESGGMGNLLRRASSNLKNATEPVTLSRNQKYKRNKKERTENFSAVIVTILTLGLSAWNAPDELKPNSDEVEALSVPFTNILLRHVPITGKLSDDGLDIIGIIAAASSYYSRTSKGWAKYNEAKRIELSAKVAEMENQKVVIPQKELEPVRPIDPVSFMPGGV